MQFHWRRCLASQVTRVQYREAAVLPRSNPAGARGERCSDPLGTAELPAREREEHGATMDGLSHEHPNRVAAGDERGRIVQHRLKRLARAKAKRTVKSEASRTLDGQLC
jgi:hypothetical protein